MSEIFLVFLLLPTMVLAFVMLTTFYGVTRAYLSLCWIPLALFTVTFLFQQSLENQHLSTSWTGQFFLAIGWTSLLQTVLGVVLGVRAFHRRETIIGLLFATILVLIPFIFRG
jgi:hypothetical protein